MIPFLANFLGDSVTLLGVDGVADDVTDGEALLVLTDVQLGLTDLVGDLLAVELWHLDTLLRGDRGAGGGVYRRTNLLHYNTLLQRTFMTGEWYLL